MGLRHIFAEQMNATEYTTRYVFLRPAATTADFRSFWAADTGVAR